jgi:GNAT superfamily N-acetyltransferase
MPPPYPNPWDALPGEITFAVGTRRDYELLQRHHYRTRKPATWFAIRVARYRPFTSPGPGKLVGVAVLSYPVPKLMGRLQRFEMRRATYGDSLRFANQSFLTVSRVIVHPQFRSVGIATELVRQLIDLAPTRYVESSAQMGRFARFLEQAGMKRFRTLDTDAGVPRPDYFVIDKQENP